jgi:tetratricopeptide (TPR) repeat protein
MKDADKNDPESRLALVLFRHSLLLEQRAFARAAGIAPSQLSVYERGGRATPRLVLEKAAAAAGFPVELLDSLLWGIRSFRVAARGKSRADRVFAGGTAAELIALVGLATDAVLTAARPASKNLSQAEAEALWAEIEPLSDDDRRMLVEDLEEYRSWSLCVRVAAESREKAANQPREALELAELALLIAELAPGEEPWRWRLQGYAWVHVANGRRACQDLPGAKEALARALQLWEAGAAADPGLLNAAVLPWIEAAVRRAERRFPEALKRIEEALALEQGELRGKILLSKSSIFQVLADPEGSAAALAEAAPLVDAEREPRLVFGLQFNLVVDLCHLERYEEAERRLPAVRALAVRLGEELDLARVVWLEGKASAGLGRTAEAQAAFEQARRVFRRRELAYDYALVSLELALLFLEQGRSAEVKTLAGEMLWIFRAQGVEREALAALRLFCDAARGESATAELARRVLRFLYRAQYDPELPFEAGKAGTR